MNNKILGEGNVAAAGSHSEFGTEKNLEALFSHLEALNQQVNKLAGLPGTLDRLTVKVEIYPKLFTGEASQIDSLRGKLRDMLRASITINPGVELHEPGVLPVFEGKAKRVVDVREQL